LDWIGLDWIGLRSLAPGSKASRNSVGVGYFLFSPFSHLGTFSS
jgi:hypothetical protein